MKLAFLAAVLVGWFTAWHFASRFMGRRRRARAGSHVVGVGRIPPQTPLVLLDEDPLDGWVRTLPQVVREQYLDRAREFDAARPSP